LQALLLYLNILKSTKLYIACPFQQYDGDDEKYVKIVNSFFLVYGCNYTHKILIFKIYCNLMIYRLILMG